MEIEAGYVVRAQDEPAGDVVLLPGFDPWVAAPRSHRDRAVPAAHAAEVSRTAGRISPALVGDGAVAGLWEHEVRDGSLAVAVREFTPVSPATRAAVETHARRYGEPLDAADVRVEWGAEPRIARLAGAGP